MGYMAIIQSLERERANENLLSAERPETGGRTRQMVLAAMFVALGCVATMLVQIPSPTNGYLNLGDAVVLLGAYLLGPAYGAVAGGAGPALADLLSGYAMYVPGTLVIKALMGLTAALSTGPWAGGPGRRRCAAWRLRASWWQATGSTTAFWRLLEGERSHWR